MKKYKINTTWKFLGGGGVKLSLAALLHSKNLRGGVDSELLGGGGLQGLERVVHTYDSAPSGPTSGPTNEARRARIAGKAL